MSVIYEEMFERSPVAMLLVDEGGLIVRVNRLTERLFGYDRAELTGKNIELLVPEELRSRHPHLVAQYVAAPLSRQMGQGRNLFGVKKGETLFPIEVGLNPLESDGQTLILASVIDITERQRADERFKAAVEAAPNGMIMIDASRTILMCNQQIEAIFGFRRDELIGQPIEMLVPGDFKAPHPSFVANYFEQPESRAMGIGRELYGLHKSGKLVPVEIGLQPIVSEGETLVISSIVDISQRKRAEVEIQRKTAEIEEFSYRTSHDLRSPLKSIAGMTDCVIEDLEEQEYGSARDGVDKISHLTTKLLKLIDDILTLTQVDAASEPIGSFDFDDFGETAREKFSASLNEMGASLEFSFHHRRDLQTQATRLTQVLDNLVSNGLKYADVAKENRYVRVHTFNNTNKFFIHVEDNGTGIPAEQQESVFGMFKRFHGSAIPGSGLGLYITRKQISKLGAEISFESSPAGTTFYVELDLDPALGPRP